MAATQAKKLVTGEYADILRDHMLAIFAMAGDGDRWTKDRFAKEVGMGRTTLWRFLDSKGESVSPRMVDRVRRFIRKKTGQEPPPPVVVIVDLDQWAWIQAGETLRKNDLRQFTQALERAKKLADGAAAMGELDGLGSPGRRP